MLGLRSRSLADHAGSALAQQLVRLTLPLASAPEPSAPAFELSPGLLGDTLSAPLTNTANTTSRSKPAAARAHAGNLTPGIRISSSQVLQLAARRLMPQAVPVKASAEHPAGLQLRSVSALGVGLRDGDVLTEAAGQKASSVAVVVGVVLAARSRQVPEISGRFYRGGVPFTLTVEQPYPKPSVPG